MQEVELKMKDEYERLANEEKARVAEYTIKWEQHLQKLGSDKDTDLQRQLDEQRKKYEAIIEDEQLKVVEA